MDPLVTAGLISAGTSLLGGFLDRKESKDQSSANVQMQKEFAQHGIRWKVEDAQRAGIHPLYALGAQTHSFSPVTVGSSMGSAVANAGQDISRAIHATRTEGERVDAFDKSVQALTLQKMGLENEVLAAQLAKMQVGPSIPRVSVERLGAPLAGQGEVSRLGAGQVETVPAQVTSAARADRLGSEAGVHPSVAWVRNEDGSVGVAMPKQLSEAYETDWLGGLDWMMRNRMIPGVIGRGKQTPPFDPKPGHEWVYDWWSDTWFEE